MIKAELITIGDEILIGQIIDTNSTWIAQQLIELGIDIWQIRSISDKKEDIIDALDSSKADLIIITGGLGPTNDDLTKNTLAEYFNKALFFDENIYKHINKLLVGRGVIVNELNKEQALLPEDTLILENKSGTASGMWFTKGEKQYISLPGVPFEMKGIMNDEVLPRLKKEYKTASIIHKTIMTQGVPESMLAMKIKEWEDNLPQSIKLAYLPRPGIVRLRLSATGNDKNKVKNIIEEQIEKINQIIPDSIYGYDEIALEKVVGDMLKEQGATISTAESCTGGQISALVTSIPGSSAYYMGSIISYNNDAKHKLLNVPNSTIEINGAVSKDVVEYMSNSVREKFDTKYAISISGIAGPDGGTKEKPVGTTWISISSKDKTVSKQFLFGEHRGRNVTRASLSALNMLRLFMMNKI